jgi:hypothetical protein
MKATIVTMPLNIESSATLRAGMSKSDKVYRVRCPICSQARQSNGACEHEWHDFTTQGGSGTAKVAHAMAAVAAFLVVGSHWYWQAEKRNNQKSKPLQQESQTRLILAQRDDDLLQTESL